MVKLIKKEGRLINRNMSEATAVAAGVQANVVSRVSEKPGDS